MESFTRTRKLPTSPAHGLRLAFARSRVLAAATIFAALFAPSATEAQRRVELVIASTTDVHGRLRGWDYYANAADPARSLAGAATIVDSIRRQNPDRTLLVDAGDLLQGNPLTFVAARVRRQPVHPVIASMNAMRYDAAVIGNHEFNYGVPLLRAAMGQAGFPFLAANVREASGKNFAAPYTIVQRSGVKVGIVGATTPGSMVWDRDNLRAERLTVTDIVPAVRKSVGDARRAGADVIVVLLHSGLSGEASYDTVATGLPSENVAARVPREIDGIDAVIFGHSHRELIDSTVNGAILVQPRNWAASVGVATLVVERRNGKWQVASHRGQSVRVAGHAESPVVLAAHATTHQNAVEWSTTSIGRTAVRLRADSARVVDVPIIDLVNEVMRREGKADLAATAAFSLDAAIDTGAISVASLSRLYPYDNTLRVVKVTGAQLRAFIEHSSRYYRSLDANGRAPTGGIIDPTVPGYNFDVVSGADYTIDLRLPLGSRVTQLEFRGRAVQPTDTFTLALNNYRQGGGGGFSMLAGAPVVYDRDTDIRQLLIDEVKRVGVLDASKYASVNWKLEPAAAVRAALAEQTRGRGAESGGGAPSSASAAGAAKPSAAGASGAGRTVRVIAISDFHAALVPLVDSAGRARGGAVALAGALAKAQSECTGSCVSLIVDGGDLFSGAPASDWDAGRPTVAVANAIGVTAGALGNHEFDFGMDTLRMRLRELRHAVLGANVLGPDGKRPSWIRSDTMITRGGIRIGIVGAAGKHTATSTVRRNVRGLTFTDPAPVISERVRALRAAGAQVVISVLHDGARCESGLATGCRGNGLEIAGALTDRPDVFVMGHAHWNVQTQVKGMPVMQATSSGRAIAITDLSLDGAPTRAEVRSVTLDANTPVSAAVDSIVRAAVSRVRTRLERPVATIAESMGQNGDQFALGNLVADAARSTARTDFAVWNNEGIRADLPAGRLLYGGVHQISPFGNVVVRMRLRGSDLLKSAEQWVRGRGPSVHVSGLTIEYDSTRAAGSRIVRITMPDGTPIVGTRVYTLALNNYMADDEGRFRPVGIITEEILTVRDIDMLARFLETRPQPVRGSAERRVRQAGGTTTR